MNESFKSSWKEIKENKEGEFSYNDKYIIYQTVNIPIANVLMWKANVKAVNFISWKLFSVVNKSEINAWYLASFPFIVVGIFFYFLLSVGLVIAFSLNKFNKMEVQKLLEESEIRDGILLESISVGVVLIESKTFAIIRINNAFCDLSGFSRNEIIGKNFDSFIFDYDKELGTDLSKTLFSLSCSFKASLKRKNGENIITLISLSSITFPNQKLTAISVRDITEMQKTTTQSKRTLQHLQTVYDSANFMIFALDKSFCYLSFNERHGNIMKKSFKKEIKIGDYFFDNFKHEEDINRIKKLFNQIILVEKFETNKTFALGANNKKYNIAGCVLKNSINETIGLTVFVKCE